MKDRGLPWPGARLPDINLPVAMTIRAECECGVDARGRSWSDTSAGTPRRAAGQRARRVGACLKA